MNNVASKIKHQGAVAEKRNYQVAFGGFNGIGLKDLFRLGNKLN
jgi:hypothetical protein